jgi:catalase
MDDAQRNRLVAQVAGSLLDGVKGEVLTRTLDYWKKIDPGVGQRIAEKVRTGSAPQPAEGMGEG